MEEDIEIGDVETYQPQKDNIFSHQSLVMSAMKKALDNGSKEMRPGYFQFKQDKSGNLIRTWIEDTRKSFVESVETILMVMSCDIDETSEKELNNLYDELKERKKYYLNLEQTEWSQLNNLIKGNLQSNGKGTIPGTFNIEKRFYQMYLDEQVEIYRQIFMCLTRLTKRLDFYVSEVFEA
jgi:hypothetical protein